jgi:hypothetical protein
MDTTRVGHSRTTAELGPQPKARPELVGVLALMAILAAFMQSPLAAIAPRVFGLDMLDDGIVVLLVLACLPKLGRAPGIQVLLIAVWGVLMMLGAAQSTVSTSGTFILFRQVTIPALLIMVGLTISRRYWQKVRRLAIWIGLINVGYMLLELVGIYLLDPYSLSTFNARSEIRNGLPGYYYYWIGGDSPLSFIGAPFMLRLGGTVLNPPIAGLVVGTALVFVWYDKSFRFRRIALVALGFTTLMTFSRGGWLVVAIALIMPYLLRKIRAVGTILVMTPALWFAATQMADDGNSRVHADGLTEGIRLAMTGPMGVGFGSVGNYVKSLRITEASESLLGIAFSAAGVLAIVLLLVLVWKLWNISRRRHWVEEAPLALGIVAAAFLSETAGGLNGTIPLWLAVGVALRRSYEDREDSPRANETISVGAVPRLRIGRDQEASQGQAL